MERKDYLLLNSKGQSTVEYILLLAVVLSLSLVVLKSDSFQNFFGKESNFFKAMKDRVEVSYRHAYVFPIEDDTTNYSTPHKSYAQDANTSRFFVGTEPYGQ